MCRGLRGAARFLGASEWTIFALLYAGFWDKRLGILGALGSTITFFATLTIILFIPNGWDPAAGFPAMAGEVPFLMKDLVLLTVSIYLLKQDIMRMALSSRDAELASSPRRVGRTIAADPVAALVPAADAVPMTAHNVAERDGSPTRELAGGTGNRIAR